MSLTQTKTPSQDFSTIYAEIVAEETFNAAYRAAGVDVARVSADLFS